MRPLLALVSVLLVAVIAPPLAAAPAWHITATVQISNLPNPAYQGYTQYRSVSHGHTSPQHTFSHKGTNGFTSTMDVGSAK